MTLAAILLSFVVTFPLVLHLSSMIYGYPGDATGTIATLWWWGYALQHGHGILNNTFWGAPIGAGWYLLPFTILPIVIFTPLTLLFGSVAAYNIGVLSSFPLTAGTTFVLGRQLRLNRLASAFMGLSFAFVPYHVEKAMGHMSQTHMEFFPALLIFLLRWYRGGSRWNLAAAGAMMGLELWIDYYFTFIIGFLALGFFAIAVLFRKQGLTVRRHLWQWAQALAIFGGSAFVFVPPAVLAARASSTGSSQQTFANQLTAYHRSLVEIQIYSARPWEYFLPWHANPLLPQAIVTWENDHLHMSNWTEQSLFLGYTTIALALIGLFLGRRRFYAALAVAIVLLGGALALPAYLVTPTGQPMLLLGHHLVGPSFFLNRIVPFFRTYARFGVLVLLGAMMLAGIGFEVLHRFLQRRRLAWLALLPFALLALEFNNQPPNHVTQLFPAPAEYAWLRGQPAGILIEYPLNAGSAQTQEIQTRQYTLYQQVHLHPIFNGATPGTAAALLEPSLEPYYSASSIAELHKLGIRYVFVHRQAYAADGLASFLDLRGLTFVRAINGTDIFLVSPNPNP